MARPLVPSSQKALLLELKGLQEEPVEGFRVTLVDEGDLYNWEVAIFGPPNTYYEGGYFKARLKFPIDYPYSPPAFRFLTKMWHPNIYETGDVCISILHPPVDDPQSGELPSERWNPTQNVRTILLSVISLLNEPNTFSPANVDASVMYRKWKESKGKDREYTDIIRCGDLCPWAGRATPWQELQKAHRHCRVVGPQAQQVRSELPPATVSWIKLRTESACWRHGAGDRKTLKYREERTWDPSLVGMCRASRHGRLPVAGPSPGAAEQPRPPHPPPATLHPAPHPLTQPSAVAAPTSPDLSGPEGRPVLLFLMSRHPPCVCTAVILVQSPRSTPSRMRVLVSVRTCVSRGPCTRGGRERLGPSALPRCPAPPPRPSCRWPPWPGRRPGCPTLFHGSERGGPGAAGRNEADPASPRRKQVLGTKVDAERDGVKVPTTLAEYCVKTKAPAPDEGSDLFYDDYYEDAEVEAEADSCFGDDEDDSGTEEC
ncbi:ubiquitin-conjugating enzyme E2 R1 isoform X1 [Eubalaena glacialis]|uniref:ubiquitin-conjugating enzyme E2 R1 isoform X1 n=1 Tax=Eubalaena glacialis TaxID=27606 RepID=UPI002A5AE757|nr:ubiquitin-conjugating enzyme E2 R1 isoform X1 [Eubalaena glacialis]